MKTDPWQVRLAKRGYRWYLALKIGKALIAIPYYPIVLIITVLAGVLVAFVEVAKVIFRLVIELGECSQDYWRKNWFKGFSREFYGSLRMYKPEPVPMRPTDAALALPAQGEGKNG